MLSPREAVRNMAPYSPPTGDRLGKLRLDFNEKTLDDPENLGIYPDYDKAIAILAEFFDVDRSQFTMTNGTDEAIQLLVNTFVEAGSEVVIPAPSYAMYAFYSELAGTKPIFIPYENDLSFPLDRLLRAIAGKTKAIFISNPNNPTGSLLELDAIRQILRAAPNAAVLIDEAYFEFCGVTVLDEIGAYENLFVSRTFSKAYGLAGLRCGCLFSNAQNVQWLKKAQSPYSVNVHAAAAASQAVGRREELRAYVDEVKQAREVCSRRLREMGLECYPSAGNFLLFKVKNHAAEVTESLKSQAILVRNREHEFPDALRVTIGTLNQTEKFLHALKGALGEVTR